MLPREADPAVRLDQRSQAATAASAASDFAAAAATAASGSSFATHHAARRRASERARARGTSRERVRDGLVGADDPPELLARAGILDRELERPLADADRLEREDRERAGTERGKHLGRAEPPSGLAAGDDAERARDVVRREHLALEPFELPDRVAADDRDVGRRVEVGDERRERERPAGLARRHGGLIGAVEVGEQAGRRPERGVEERTPGLLVEHGLLEERQAGAAVLLGDRRTRPAELGELCPRRRGRRLEEGARLTAELVLQGGEGEVISAPSGDAASFLACEEQARLGRRERPYPEIWARPRTTHGAAHRTRGTWWHRLKGH